MKLFNNSKAEFGCQYCGNVFYGAGDQVEWNGCRGKFQMNCPKCKVLILSDSIVLPKAKAKGENHANRKRK